MSATRITDLLRAFDEQSAGLSGAAFFHEIVREMAHALDAPCAFVSSFDTTHRSATVLALWAQEPFEPCATYELEDSPCAPVSQGKIVRIRDAAGGRLPPWLGQRGYISYLAVPVRAGDGRVGGQLAVMDKTNRDWTDGDVDVMRLFALRAAGTLERAAWDEREQHLYEALGTLGHELRTPLNAILGYAQLLLRDANISTSQRNSLETMRSAGAQLQQRVGEMRDVLKVGGTRLDAPQPAAQGAGEAPAAAERAPNATVADSDNVRAPVAIDANLDPALLALLYHHAKGGDVNALLAAIDSIGGPVAHPLAEELRRLTRNFDLKSVRQVLEPLLASAGAVSARRSK